MSLIKAKDYTILIDEEPAVLLNFIDRMKPSSIFVIVDENTGIYCLPYLKEHLRMPFSSIRMASGEKFKNLKSCSQVWNALMKYGCDRDSLVINLGGGVIGDMGGFIASTYMRGVRFIQMPTTLLSQVDASVGGKLGIDFLGYKNMIGVFNNPEMVWIQSRFLQSLPDREMKSGLAEVIKHALIRSESHWREITALDGDPKTWPLDKIIKTSVDIKNAIVLEDPREQSLRKILNFGHTVGHAVESQWLESDQALLHGEAIAIGMVCEAHLSWQKGLLKDFELRELTHFIKKIYTHTPGLLDEADSLIERMGKDKKNRERQIRCALIRGIGDAVFDQPCQKDEIVSAFRYFENFKP